MPIAGGNKHFARVLIENSNLKVVDLGLCSASAILTNEQAVAALSSSPRAAVRVSGLGDSTNELREMLRAQNMIRP